MAADIDSIGRNMVILIAAAIVVCGVLSVLVYLGKIRQKGPHNRGLP
ncbi:MAG TPA: hypothetical protein VKE70_15855 [Candidatus Solibacter sp.]|nr:hypothetical protein [Candidatus Solibacter sp.]